MISEKEAYWKGVKIFDAKGTRALEEYLKTLKGKHELARKALEVFLHVSAKNPEKGLFKALKTLPELQREPGLLLPLYISIFTACRVLGELEMAENYIEKYRELCLRICKRYDYVAETEKVLIALARGDMGYIVKQAPEIAKRAPNEEQRGIAKLMLSVAHTLAYDPKRGLELAEEVIGNYLNFISPLSRSAAWEAKGLALRILGDLRGAQRAFLRAVEIGVELGVISGDPCARVLETHVFGGAEPPPKELIDKAMAIARQRRVATLHIAEALLSKEDMDVRLIEAAEIAKRAWAPFEAVYAAFLGLRLIIKHKKERGFWKGIEVLREHARKFGNLRQDPLVGPTYALLAPLIEVRVEPGLRAKLFGRLRVWVDGAELSFKGWRNRRALRLLVYLLLTPQHRLKREFLLYLLWPEDPEPERAIPRLKVAASYLRKRLGKPGILVFKDGYYELRDVRTDLDDLREAALRGEVLREPKGELLPEFAGDPYVEEHRQNLERLLERAGAL